VLVEILHRELRTHDTTVTARSIESGKGRAQAASRISVGGDTTQPIGYAAVILILSGVAVLQLGSRQGVG